jgi:hypothetical protein
LTRTSFLSFLLLVAASAASAHAQTGPWDRFLGEWQLDIDRWEFDVDSQPKSQNLRFEPSAPTVAKVVVTGRGRENQPITRQHDLKLDGTARPVPAGQGAFESVTDRRVDERTVESAYRKGGKVMKTVRYAVSADGKTLTVTFSGTNPRGQAFKFNEFYRRPKAGGGGGGKGSGGNSSKKV